MLKMKQRIVTFGEIMLRLKPPAFERFFQSPVLEATFGGGEANVAVSCANYGLGASFITKLPEGDIGQAALNSLRARGVNTAGIRRGGERLGIYFVEKGASQRASKVIYDRAASSIATAVPGDFDWDAAFSGADWFHFTGITPALGGHLPEICLEALKTAKKHGLTVSWDLNYRKKLWSREEAGRVMAELAPYVDVSIGNEEDAADVFGIRADNTDIDGGKISHDGYIEVARRLQEQFGFKKVAITLRGSLSASDNDWAGMLYDNGQAYFSDSYRVHIVDRVGGGDSFAGGLIYALLSGYDAQRAVDFAAAASCLKHTIEFDYNLASVDEVAALAAGNASGRVQR